MCCRRSLGRLAKARSWLLYKKNNKTLCGHWTGRLMAIWQKFEDSQKNSLKIDTLIHNWAPKKMISIKSYQVKELILDFSFFSLFSYQVKELILHFWIFSLISYQVQELILHFWIFPINIYIYWVYLMKNMFFGVHLCIKILLLVNFANF